VVVTGASERNLITYRALGLRTLRIGDEAVVDPGSFTLAGRGVRKVRQSVARVERQGYAVEVVEARELAGAPVEEIAGVEAAWRAAQPRLHGFSTTLGRLWGAPEDACALYVLGRDPDGRLVAFMRFVEYASGLSLDAMRRLPEPLPNGLNEALIVAVLGHARERSLAEVSLNFAGLAHLMAADAALGHGQRLLRFVLRRVHRRFQLERLVRFNQKFRPTWRPRYLVYEDRVQLPLAALRVLQAEAYVRQPRPRWLSARWRPLARPVAEEALAT
jgi:lysyl-tRNA synthetase class 2